jgi:hypothetical protein
MDTAGNYVVVWSSNHLSSNYGIFAQRYDAKRSIGSECNPDPPRRHANDASGRDGFIRDFVATWASKESGNWEIVAAGRSLQLGRAERGRSRQ